MKKVITGLLSAFISLSLIGQNLKIEPDLRMLALGDSYTIGESVEVSERWPVQFTDMVKQYGVNVEIMDIIAQTGWTTRNLRNAIESSLDLSRNYNLVSLLIGVNNQYQGQDINIYPSEFTTLLKKAIDIVDGDVSKVLVLSIPDYAFTPFGKGNPAISNDIDRYNEINRSVSDSFGVAYVDITDISRMGLDWPNLVAKDGLHPSGSQYKEWVHRIIKIVDFKINTEVTRAASGPLALYPNPAHDFITIPAMQESFDLVLFDPHGKELMRQEAVSGQVTINLESFPAGLYLILLYNDKRKYSQRIIRKK